MNLPDKAVELITCPTCHAIPGAPCRSRSGRKLTDHGRSCHTGRFRLVHEVWLDGFDEGLAEVTERSEYWCSRARDAEQALKTLRADLLLLVKGGDQ